MTASKLKKTILGIAIAIILAFFWGFGTNTIYEPPRFDDFCKNIPYSIEVESCDNITIGDEQIDEKIIPLEKGCSCREINKEGDVICKTTNPEYEKCQEEYDNKRENHGKFSFIILLILGIISVIISLFIKVDAVGSGIMGGGVLTMIYGTMRYWGSIQDYGRLLILGIALAILIWIGYKKLKN